MLHLTAVLLWVSVLYRPVFSEEISIVEYAIGQTQQGRDIVVERFGDGGSRILLIGCIHGTEDIGVRLLNHTMFHLRSTPGLMVKSLMLPLLNADGLIMNIRVIVIISTSIDNFTENFIEGGLTVMSHCNL